MGGSAYAAGWPFGRGQFGQGQSGHGCSSFEQIKEELLAAMTGRQRHGGHHQAFGGMWGPMFGGPPWAGGQGPRGWRQSKARRGDVRAAILAVLAEESMNGYQIIQVVAERSGGAWKPSPGSIYPTLQQLEDEGLVTADAATGRRTFSLTDEGRAYVAEHADEVSAPWETMGAGADDDESGLKPLLGQVGGALWQVLATGTPEQQAKARKALIELRRTLYGILGDDEQDR